MLGTALAVAFRASDMLEFGDGAVNMFATLYLFAGQELWVSVALAVIIPVAWTFAQGSDRDFTPSTASGIAIITLIAIVLTWVLRWGVFHDFDLTQDEFLPRFQAEIFRNGTLFAALSADQFALNSIYQPLFTVVNDTHLL